VNTAAPGSAAPSIYNLANALTLVRFLLVPVVVAFMFVGDGEIRSWRVAACAVFAVAILTDRVDGDLARRRGLITNFGKIADPIADKALVGSAMVGLSVLGELPWWVTILIMVREIGITAMRFAVIQHGVMAASRGGKLKTVLQAVAIGLYLLNPSGTVRAIADVAMGIAVVVTVVTAVDYIASAVRMRRASIRAARVSGDGLA
jgi:CDP-diacylglycerol--glycerol-3-phosphate 3-phosphatidyltransferase